MNYLVFIFSIFTTGISFSYSHATDFQEESFNYFCPHIYPETITNEKMQYDLRAFKYLLESSYSGFENAASKGLNIENLIDCVGRKFSNQHVIRTDTVAQELMKGLAPYINDVHFGIASAADYYKSFKSEKIYFSDIFLERQCGEFIVSEDNSENIPVGTRYLDSEIYLFLYPAKGENMYRLGLPSTEENDSLSKKIDFSLENAEIFFTRSKIPDYSEKTIFDEFETRDSAFIKITDFIEVSPKDKGFNEKHDIFKRYVKFAKKYRNKKNIILDLRSNCGGNDTYSFNFFKNLYGHRINFLNAADSGYGVTVDYLVSKPIKEFIENDDVYKKGCSYYLKYYEKNKKAWFTMKSKDKHELETPKFKGTIFLLVNKNTASSGEETILFARQMLSKTNQIKVVGENTTGCITYGNVIHYWLPNSGIRIDMPSSKYAYSVKGKEVDLEGKGFYPDYWSNDEDMKATLINLTGDKDLEKVDVNKISRDD